MLRKGFTCKAAKPWTEAAFYLHSTDARRCHNTSSGAMDHRPRDKSLDGGREGGRERGREGGKEGRNESWKLKTSSDISKSKNSFTDLFSPYCYSE